MQTLIDIIKKYWDIFGGIITGMLLSWLARFKTPIIQTYYSIIILILTSIGVLKIIKQSLEVNKEKRKKRKETLIDKAVDSQKPLKAVNVAQSPTKAGEQLGMLLLKLLKEQKRHMKKIKKFFEKFKGYMLTVLLGALTVVEYVGGVFNEELSSFLTYKGINILPIITLVLALIVGMLSNGFTKEQLVKIKNLLSSSKSSTNELVQAEIKSQLKNNKALLATANKELSVLETELEQAEEDYNSALNVLTAKQQMFSMTPQLATEEDVASAESDVAEKLKNLRSIQNQIVEKQKYIKTLETTISALEEAQE